jgi:hypothetical protein
LPHLRELHATLRVSCRFRLISVTDAAVIIGRIICRDLGLRSGVALLLRNAARDEKRKAETKQDPHINSPRALRPSGWRRAGDCA